MMGKKPTYEELEKRIKALAKEAGAYRQAEEALQQSEEKYRTILRSIEDGYFEVGLSGNLTFFNDSLCKILGYFRDELLGMNHRHYTDKMDVKEVYQTFNKVYKTGEPAKAFDWKIIRKNGEVGYIEASVSLMRDEDGKPKGFQGIVRDITGQKLTDEALKESEERLRNIFDSVQAGIMIIDAETHRITDVNPVAEKLIGIPGEKIVGKICHQYICPAQVGECPITDLGEEVNNSERVLLRPIGENVPILQTVVPITLNGHNYLLGSFVNISDLKAAQEMAQKETSKLSAMISGMEEGVTFADADNVIVEVNDYFCKSS